MNVVKYCVRLRGDGYPPLKKRCFTAGLQHQLPTAPPLTAAQWLCRVKSVRMTASQTDGTGQMDDANLLSGRFRVHNARIR